MRVIFVELGQILYSTGKIIIKMSAAHFSLLSFVSKLKNMKNGKITLVDDLNRVRFG